MYPPFLFNSIEFATPCVPFSKEDVALNMLGINVLLSEMSAINSFEFAKSNKGSNIETPPIFLKDFEMDTGQTDKVSLPFKCKATPLCTMP